MPRATWRSMPSRRRRFWFCILIMSKPTMASPWSSLKRSDALSKEEESSSSEMVEGMEGRRLTPGRVELLLLWGEAWRWWEKAQVEGRKMRRRVEERRERTEEGCREGGRELRGRGRYCA